MGSTTTYSSTTVGGAWTSGTTGVATIDATGVITPVSAGISLITYTVTNGSGCTNTATQNVTVNVLPSPSITGSASVCENVTGSVYSVTSVGGNTYLWAVVGGSITAGSTTNSITVTWGSAGPGTVNVTETITATGCFAAATQKSVTVNAIPGTPNSISGSAAMCMGTSTTYSSTTVGGAWTSGTVGVATIDASGAITPVSAGSSLISYIVTTNGCSSAAATKTITVNALPSAPNAISGSAGVCMGSTTTYSSTTPGGVWTSGTTGVATIAAGVISPVSVGSSLITYTVTDVNGCTNTATKTITVNALPTPSITGSGSLCAGTTGSVYSALDVSGHTYLWAVVGGSITAGQNTNSITVTWGIAGTGTVDVTETITATTCSAVATQKSVTINANPGAPNAITYSTTSICMGSTTTYSSTTVGGAWTSGTTGVATIDATGVITPVSAGTSLITYTVTNGSGCTNTTTQNVTVNALPSPSITGSASVCENVTGSVYSVTSVGVGARSQDPRTAIVIAKRGDRNR